MKSIMKRKNWQVRFWASAIGALTAAWVACFAPAMAAAGVYTTAIQKHNESFIVRAGATARTGVVLGYYGGAGQRGFQVLPHKTLTFYGVILAGGKTVPFLLFNVRTDANGAATIQFTMPHRLRDSHGREVGTSVLIYVGWPGEGNLPPAYTYSPIEILVGS